MIYKFVAVLVVTEHVYIDFNIDVASEHRMIAQEKAANAAKELADRLNYEYLYVTERDT